MIAKFQRNEIARWVLLLVAGPLATAGCGSAQDVPAKDRALVERLRIVRDMVDERASQLEVAANLSKSHSRDVWRGLAVLFDDVAPIMAQLRQRAKGAPVEADIKSLEADVQNLARRLHKQKEPLERIRSSTESFQRRLAEIEQRLLR